MCLRQLDPALTAEMDRKQKEMVGAADRIVAIQLATGGFRASHEPSRVAREELWRSFYPE